ncbi:hypothetical protein EV361DRAFT_943131 [Lentinula raphanica]|nr:hypothetical protein EV361DRAFT_943131 [Lentinula raphanica]
MLPITTALLAKIFLLLTIVNSVASPIPDLKPYKHNPPEQKVKEPDRDPEWRHLFLVRQIIDSKGYLVYVDWNAKISKKEIWSVVLLWERHQRKKGYFSMRTQQIGPRTGPSTWEKVTRLNQNVCCSRSPLKQKLQAREESPPDLAHVNLEIPHVSLGRVRLTRDENIRITKEFAQVRTNFLPLIYINAISTKLRDTLDKWVASGHLKDEDVELDLDETWIKDFFFKMLCMNGTAGGSVITEGDPQFWYIYRKIEAEFRTRGLVCPPEKEEGERSSKTHH